MLRIYILGPHRVKEHHKICNLGQIWVHVENLGQIWVHAKVGLCEYHTAEIVSNSIACW